MLGMSQVRVVITRRPWVPLPVCLHTQPPRTDSSRRMHMLIDLGIARPQLELFQMCSALIQKVATALTVLMDGGRSATPLCDQVAARLGIPAELPLDLRASANHPWKALQ